MQKGVTDKYASGNIVIKQTNQLGAVVLGDINSAVDKHIIKPSKIQTIFTFGHDAVPQKQEQNIKYKQYNIMDNKNQKINDILDQVYEQIQQARKVGGVLLHCYTGISRSPAMIIAYLMRKRQMAYDNARTLVKKCRSVIHPNDNFHRQLQGYEKQLAKRRQQERLKLQKQLEKQKQSTNQSMTFSNVMSNTSTLSKRTGLRGAVRSAHRQIKQQKSQENQVKSIQKPSKILLKIEEENTKRSLQKVNKQVKNVYSSKTKVK